MPHFDSFWQYVEYWATIAPNFPAMKCEDQVVSSQQFEDITNRLATAFLNLGVQKGDRIVTVLPTRPEYMFILVAANKIGAITVPMDVRYRRSDFVNLIPHLEPRIVISITKDEKFNFAEAFQKLANEVADLKDLDYYFIGELWNEFGKPFDELLAGVLPDQSKLDGELAIRKKDQHPNDDMLIIWTGGTTGFPKAALLSNENVVAMCLLENEMIRNYIISQGVLDRSTLLSNLPPSHVGGTVEILGVGVVGGYKLVLHDRWSATKTLQSLQDDKVVFYLAAPTMWRILMGHPLLPDTDLSHFKFALISGEIVDIDFLKLMQEKICKTIVNGYGSTESGAEVTFTAPDDDYTKMVDGYVGKPLKGMEIRIIDGEGNHCPPSEKGEVIIKGVLVCKGYFRNEEENIKGFTADGYIKTGDLGYLDNEGGLWLSGRLKEIIRVGTYTVLPQEIEDVVYEHFDLELAAAVGVPDKILGEVVWLAITPKEGVIVDDGEVLEVCQRELANYKVPKRIVRYDFDPANPPLTRIGKKDRKRLKAEILAEHDFKAK
ncbi:MAG: class I adenylate-forming enzyme family protein [Candidatus Hodarchaeales archaeon]